MESTTTTSPIVNFFAGRSVFVTGATGFIGKVLVEKLLRSCKDLENVYILARAKKGKSVWERCADIVNSKLFDRLRQERPEAIKKLIPVDGDMCQPGLGFSESDTQMLVEKVSVVFHCAASVKFNDPMRKFIAENLISVQHVVALAEKMNLAAFVHLSTAYSNCDLTHVAEKIYHDKQHFDDIIAQVHEKSDEELKAIEKEWFNGKPNGYAYTKNLAENYLETVADRLPVTIVRPSMVMSSWKEPYPGWVDSYNAGTAFFVSFGKGVLHSIMMDPEKPADFIPVDVVVNLMIAAAWRVANKECELEIYNCVTGPHNPISWGKVIGELHRNVKRVPYDHAMMYPGMTMHKSKSMYKVNEYVTQFLPYFFMDLNETVFSKKKRAMKAYTFIKQLCDSLEYFTANGWEFESDNLYKLLETMTPEDRETFSIDIRQIDWDEVMFDYWVGIKKFLLKEDLSSIAKEKERNNKLYWFQKGGLFAAGMALLGTAAVFRLADVINVGSIKQLSPVEM